MNNSNFKYLAKEFPILFNIGQVAEMNLYGDPVTALFKLRQFAEKLTELLFEEHYLEFPYENTFNNQLRTLKYEGLLPDRINDLLHTVKNKGNVAVHQNKGTLEDAKTALFSTFKVAKWFCETYGKETEDISLVKFSLPSEVEEDQALNKLEADYKALEEKFNQLLAKREIKEEAPQQRKAIIQRSEKAALKVEMNEDETRVLIDQQLKEAGWEVDTHVLNHWKNKTLPEPNRKMAIAEWVFPNGKRADYALFIGEELYGVVEAKKWGNDISQDLRQAKLYSEYAGEQSDYLIGEWGVFRVPFVFTTNGRPFLEQIKTKSGIWFLDLRSERNRSRPLRGWFTPDGLKELYDVDRKESDKKLEEDDAAYLQSKAGLGLRDYQMKAIKAVESKIAEQTEDRRALLAMATGTGKTRTTLGLCYRLIKANRFKRILFLVDRTLLAEQALGTFKDTKVEDINTFSQTYQISKMTEMVPELDTRLHFSTVQSLVKRLFYSDNEEDRLPIDTYDCIIVDEAHRGYLQDRELDEEELSFKNANDYVSKYRMVLDYFDAFAIGLTATPALHTKEIFGKAVYTYSYREAVIDGYLVDHEPPFIIKTRLSEEGITWGKGEKPKAFDAEENSLVELEELEDELNIDITGFNNLVITESFNRTVVKQLVQEIDPEGDEKTLIFAANDNHADRVVLLLKEEYENIGVDLADHTIEKITGKSYNPKELVKRYKNEKFPTIAVTVDLLSTGIDVPPICNIVFLRRIKSRILYEQMLGRATRLCPEIGKETFRIYDAVRVYETLQEFTSMKPVVPNPSTTFMQLAEEMPLIESNERAKKQLDQIIAKLQRKKRLVAGRNEDQFKYLSEDQDPESFINMLQTGELNESIDTIINKTGLWKFLDELKSPPRVQFWSDHEDEYISTERGYGKGQKPDDYLNSFKEFVTNNQNKLMALNIICTRPKELDRQSLKELKLVLDQEGFNVRSLNTAWKQAKNEDIAADIIGYIRTLALGSSLVSHEERIRNAVQKVRDSKEWNKIQLKWIERFEKQLLQEEVIKREDLDADPFDEAGGFERLDKIFEHQLDEVLERINANLYDEIA